MLSHPAAKLVGWGAIVTARPCMPLLGIAVGKRFNRSSLVPLSDKSPSPRSPGLARRCFHRAGGLFDDRGDRIRLRHINRMTARNLDDSGTRALGHEALCRWWDHLVVGGYQVPARLSFPRRLANRAAQRFK